MSKIHYKAGGFYTSDDDNSLVHVFFSHSLSLPPTNESDVKTDQVTSSEKVEKKPLPIATCSLATVAGSTLTLKNVFAKMNHKKLTLKATTLFIQKMKLVVGACIESAALTRSAKRLFNIRIFNSYNKEIEGTWFLFSAVADQKIDYNSDGTPVDPNVTLPSLSTSLVASAVLDVNSMYTLRDARIDVYLACASGVSTDNESYEIYSVEVKKFDIIEYASVTERE